MADLILKPGDLNDMSIKEIIDLKCLTAANIDKLRRELKLEDSNYWLIYEELEKRKDLGE
jgi:hypothetical protein